MATTTTADGRNGEGEQKRKEKGGFKTMPFILGNDICDKFASTGFGANFITYLTVQLHMPMVEASNLLTNFGGTSSLTPILGAIAADSFAGRFWTIIVGSVFYQLGMLGLLVSALLPSLRPSPCSAPPSGPGCQRASGLQLTVLYLSLLCKSVGTGGLRPCVVMFGTDQFDHEPGAEQQQVTAEAAEAAAERKRLYFNLYFFAGGVASMLALTGVVYIQDHVGWGWGFGIPAIAMFVSIVVFLIGYPLYVRLKPGGSPFTRLAQVAAAAYKKRNVAVPEDTGMLYQDKELDVLISTNGRLLHTNQLTFLDRAAIVMPGDISASGQPDLWRLSTVHRVEELKSIVRLLPIWSAGIMLATVEAHGPFTILQARSMDRHITRRFEIPAATMSIFGTMAFLVSLALYDRSFVPLARRVTGLQSGITYFQRMGIGLAIHILGVATAALVETKRRHAAADHGLVDKPTAVVPLSVFWLVPQFAVNGVAGAFSSVAHMEFLYDQSPESMRSTAAALFCLSSSIGHYLSTVLVTVVQRTTRAHGNDWLQDNINRGRIDNYYWLVTCLMVLNLGYYLICFQSTP
ncbi:unnamed protein product [Miscanthus lutarioriparius]|uniref:NPF family transporter n=1 Tax=Miscanthus lutarioriparius TaxID=422564 RepID=A0A811RXM1_9POAL|nr:unnamed protein product [Miscanthus lutarioriparius]